MGREICYNNCEITTEHCVSLDDIYMRFIDFESFSLEVPVC